MDTPSGAEIFGNLVAEGLHRVIDYPKGLVIQFHESDETVRRRVALLSLEEAREALAAAVISEVHRRSGSR